MAAYLEDTIAAIATAPGTGAIAVLRLSGRESCSIAAKVLRATKTGKAVVLTGETSHRARRAQLFSVDGSRSIDDVLVLPMLGPRSYTGEDVVEIHCHGGKVASDLALRSLLGAGARLARRGEFTERAYLNGRLDLCQAEAVADMITAHSTAALDQAHRQLTGGLSDAIQQRRSGILDARALVEAHLDFPEEDLPPGVETALVEDVAALSRAVRTLADTYERGRLTRDGMRVVLAGKPNVGKSSLLNCLLGRPRALVSEEAGTTRDYLEEPLAVAGVEVLLSDTAGIREGTSHVERAGVERSEEQISRADLLLVVLDGSRPLQDLDRALLEDFAGRRRIIVRNKNDLPQAWDASGLGPTHDCRLVSLSAKTEDGLADLLAAMATMVPESDSDFHGLAISNARQHTALEACDRHLEEARNLLCNGGPLELVAAELQEASSSLDDLLGRTDNEEILGRIFERFCVGK